ncbi:hypothetical protein A6R68_16538 [Neotoma lepida]|uniref:Uncharacterized protein n=1 Tax=Neotoma lepida TaxID=56216 RepID=A0A1A6HFK0_NEOLE|nr:hypothetical protein A6R68_16538 [Neotoma lepida]
MGASWMRVSSNATCTEQHATDKCQTWAWWRTSVISALGSIKKPLKQPKKQAKDMDKEDKTFKAETRS